MAVFRRPYFDKSRNREARREWREREFKPRFAEGGYGTDKELHSLFLRTKRDVDFKGAFTPAEIDNRLREAASFSGSVRCQCGGGGLKFYLNNNSFGN